MGGKEKGHGEIPAEEWEKESVRGQREGKGIEKGIIDVYGLLPKGGRKGALPKRKKRRKGRRKCGRGPSGDSREKRIRRGKRTRTIKFNRKVRKKNSRRSELQGAFLQEVKWGKNKMVGGGRTRTEET